MKKLLSLLVCVCMAATFMAIPALATADYSDLIEECLTTEVKTAITKNLTLPSEWSDLPITWKSSNTNVIANNGTVKRPAADTTVTLTAYQAGEAVKELEFTVIAQGTKVWYSENFYRPSLVGTELRTTTGAASTPLDFVEKTNSAAGKAGFHKKGGSLAIAENPKKANDYALLAASTENNGTISRTDFYFALPNGALPTGKVTVKWTLTTTGFDNTTTATKKNFMKYINVFNDEGKKITAFQWLSPTSNGSYIFSNSYGITGMPFDATLKSFSNTVAIVYDFDAGTVYFNEKANGTMNSTAAALSNDNNGRLKSFNIYHRSDGVPANLNGNFYVDDIVITSTEQYIDVPERTTTLKATYDANRQRYTITSPYNDTYNLVQEAFYVQDKDNSGNFIEYNNLLDFGNLYLQNKSNASDTVYIHMGSDDNPSCNVNGSYIGGRHGHTAGIIVSVDGGHGKTYADIGSRWSYNNKIWNLLRIENDTDLLFISDDKGPVVKSTYSYAYSFHTIAKGTAVTFTHAGTADDNSEAVNKTDISGVVKEQDAQVRESFKPARIKVFRTNDGVREEITEQFHAGGLTVEADTFELEEFYTVMNPTKIADGLRKNRPEGGYTENPCLAVGEALFEVNNKYVYKPDGTMLVYMDYHYLVDLGRTNSLGLTYCYESKGDTAGFGGGVYRYIPKVKPLENLTAYDPVNKVVASEKINLDLTQPWRLYTGLRPNGYNIVKSDWEDENNPPDRDVLYYADKTNPDKLNTVFALGYLPIEDGVPENRKDKLVGGAYYLYRTNKGYPTFISVQNVKAGEHHKGVAYKKIQEVLDNNHNYTSVYSVDYEDGKYYYIDYHKSGTDTITLPTTYNYTVVEKSDNVSYSSMDNLITTTADCSTKKYGYIVLKATNAETVRIADGAYDGVMGNLVAYFENDTNSDKDLTAIAATYDETGKLVETVTLKDFTVEANKDVQKIFPFETKGASAARVFTFNSLNILQAATKSHHIEIIK